MEIRMTSEVVEFSPTFSRMSPGGSYIDDDHTQSTSTWSSEKISQELDLKANSTALAPAYASGTRYAVGDLCTYQGNLMRCKTAIASAPATPASGSWDTINLQSWVATAAQVQAIITGYTA